MSVHAAALRELLAMENLHLLTSRAKHDVRAAIHEIERLEKVITDGRDRERAAERRGFQKAANLAAAKARAIAHGTDADIRRDGGNLSRHEIDLVRSFHAMTASAISGLG